MKKLIYLLTLVLIGSVAVADSVPIPTPYMPPNQEKKEQDAQPKTETQEVVEEPKIPQKEPEKREYKFENSEYTAEVKGLQTFYYDKYGKFIARDKKVNGQVFFYNKSGQFAGKSVERGDKTYYYNSANKFLGVCDENVCKDSEFNVTGKIPPLPEIKHFKPVYDDSILNPQSKTSDKDDEE